MEKERIALGVKQLEKDPFSEALKDNVKIGKVVTCVIENVLDTGLEVSIDKGTYQALLRELVYQEIKMNKNLLDLLKEKKLMQ